MLRRTITVFSLCVLESTGALCQIMSQQAQVAAQQPAKVELVPERTKNNSGHAITVRLRLLDGNGNPTSAREPVNTQIEVKQPSGQTTYQSVTLSSGESSKQVDLSIPESGVTQLTVRQPEQRLIGSKKYVLMTPHVPASTPPKKAKPLAKKPVPQSRMYAVPSKESRVARFVLTAYALQSPASPAADYSTGPESQFLLKVSGEDAGGGIRADGKTCANVQVFYMGAKDLNRVIQVWLRWSNGNMSPNPLIFNTGTREADACWTSLYPLPQATVQIVGTNPHIPFAASDTAIIKFSENIRGVDFANPPDSITLVDSINLTAMFYDPFGQPVKLLTPRALLFNSNSGVVHLAPQHATIAAGSFDSSIMVIPTFWGSSNLEVFADGYPKARHTIKITWLGVLLCSLLGGSLGGWLAFINSAGKLFARIAAGVIVGLVASWAYVFVGLPKVDASIVHNQLSVVFVSLLASFVGVKAVSKILEGLKFGF